MTGLIKILKAFKACDPELWGHTDIYSPDAMNGDNDFMDAAAFHMEAVAFYAMITHIYEGNDDTDEKSNPKEENYPVAYLIAKFTNSRSIDVAALRDAVKSRLKAADLPNFCTRKDYFHAVGWFLTHPPRMMKAPSSSSTKSTSATPRTTSQYLVFTAFSWTSS
jgi:hypothetical protein